jgi:hypothetical protein
MLTIVVYLSQRRTCPPTEESAQRKNFNAHESHEFTQIDWSAATALLYNP